MKKAYAILLAALLGGPPGLLKGVIWHVPDPHPVIQAALDTCASGDTVLVAPGHYHERLVVPNRTITLASHTLLTGDTLFIPQTILDGDSLGTVLTVAVGGLNRFILDGFTIQGGVGSHYHGGGIHFADSTDAEIRNLHFTGNYSTDTGTCVYGDGLSNPFRGPRRFIMRHVRAFENQLSYMGGVLFRIKSNHYSEVTNLICNNANYGIISLASNDSVIVNGVYSSNNTCHTLIDGGLPAYTQHSYQEYRDIHVSNTVWDGNSLVIFSGRSKGIVKNLSFINNSQVGPRNVRTQLLSISLQGVPSEMDSLIFRSNRGLVQGSTVGELERSRALDENWVHGEISNLIVEDCALGDSSYTPWNSSTNYPSMLTTERCSVKNAVFRNNRITLTPGVNTPEWGVEGARLWRHMTLTADSIYIRNVLFENNLVIDLDDNDALPAHWANEGRCLYMWTGAYLSFVVDSCIFDGNRQPNMAAELPFGGIYGDDIDVGSVLQVHRNGPTNNNGTKCFSNIILRNNDDGGIRSREESDLLFRNVQMINMSRQGFDLEAESVTLENVLIDGCTPYLPIATRSEQMPLRLAVIQPSAVRNSTIINCTTPYVIMAGLTPHQEPRDPIVTIENCLFWDNQYVRFEALVPQYDWPGWDSYRPGRFNHCLLPEAAEYGEANLIGVDPLFDADWGPPYLSPFSPCIDIGVPELIWNDVEDPSQPSFALWPSLGGLRNDVGFTGGPHAAVFDTNWVALPRWEPRVQPLDFSLDAPWPNPFNPVTRIPFTLVRTFPVRLSVHNLLGQEVAVLMNGIVPAGVHQAIFNPGRLASGLYLVTLEAAGRVETRTVTLLR